MPAAPQLDFWFELASTYSYPAAMRIGALAQRRGIHVRWRPFLLGPIFKAQGWLNSPFNIYPAKGRYMWRDLERLCGRYGISWRRPGAFPRNGMLAARVGCAAGDAPWTPAFYRAVFRANFAEDRDVSDPALVQSLLERCGQDGAAWVARASSPEAKQALRDRTAEAARLGIFGAPDFVVEGELFFGQDRLDEALAWATR